MDNQTLIIVAVVIAVAVVALAFLFERRRRLREQFGPEYDRAVRDAGGTSRAEAELAARLP